MPAVRAVLCDLDDTLFDHQHASRHALGQVHGAVPGFACWSIEEFMTRHAAALEAMHLEVLEGRLTVAAARLERFRRLLTDAGAARSDERAGDVARLYRRAYETAWQPVRGAIELVATLKRERLAVAVVSNNVVVEQRMKLQRCGLAGYVDTLVTSEEVGASKPDARIFGVALERVCAAPDVAVMLGDAWSTDIVGARAAGVRAVWLNRRQVPSPDAAVPELRSLEPVTDVLRLLVGR
jgi:putative hydrolase of the HAD superfamily